MCYISVSTIHAYHCLTPVKHYWAYHCIAVIHSHHHWWGFIIILRMLSKIFNIHNLPSHGRTNKWQTFLRWNATTDRSVCLQIASFIFNLPIILFGHFLLLSRGASLNCANSKMCQQSFLTLLRGIGPKSVLSARRLGAYIYSLVMELRNVIKHF